jgi:putative DNA primase/helicase
MTYDIRTKTNLLTKSAESPTKYHCPVCNGNDLDINPDSGAYKCFVNECSSEAIRKAIDKLEGKPEQWVKSVRAASSKTYSYRGRNGENLAEVKRIDDGKGNKKIWQRYFCGEPKTWQNKKDAETARQIPIYKYKEIREAIANGQQIWVVEGEQPADDLWDLGIPATTTIGGSKGYGTYGDYSQDLIGARLVLCPDRDATGLKYMANFARDLADQIDGYYLAGEVEAWSKPSDGRDLSDDIELHATKESILAKVITVEQFNEITSSAKPQAAKESKKNKKESEGSSKFRSSIDHGLQIYKDGEEDGEGKWVKIGDHITAIAETDSVNGGERSLVLEFCDQEGEIRTIIFDKGYFFDDGGTSLKVLARDNYKLTNRKNREKLLDYLYTLGQGLPVVHLSNTTGWHGQTYVGAIKSYGSEDIRWKDITPPKGGSLPIVIGTSEGWINGVARPCHGNSRAMAAIGMGLAGCLVRPLMLESGGIHFWGGSGSGKTTLGKIACSVTGQSKLRQWRSTPNGIEMVFRMSNDNLMGMDELTKDMGRYLAEIIYMLNGESKNRSTRNLSLAAAGSWSVMLFSTGEISSIALLESVGDAVKAGQEVRFTDVPASPPGGFGCFETVHGQDPAAFTLGIERACLANSGVVLDAFLARVQTAMLDENWSHKQREIVEHLADKLTGDSKTPAIRRIARRFAVIKLALDLACDWGLIPWAAEDNLWAVNKLFDEWLNQRGGDGSIEIKRACENIAYLLTTNELGERFYTLPDNNGQKPRNQIGFRKVDSSGEPEELWVMPEVFQKEFCKGVNHTEVAKELNRLGLLFVGSDEKSTTQRKHKNKQSRYYVFPLPLKTGGAGGAGGADTSNTVREGDTGTRIAPLAAPLGSGAGGAEGLPHHRTTGTTTGSGADAIELNPLLERDTATAPPAPPQKRESPETDKENKKQQLDLNIPTSSIDSETTNPIGDIIYDRF